MTRFGVGVALALASLGLECAAQGQPGGSTSPASVVVRYADARFMPLDPADAGVERS